MFDHPLARDLARLLAIKLIVLAALYAAFFSPARRPEIDPSERIGGAPAITAAPTTHR